MGVVHILYNNSQWRVDDNNYFRPWIQKFKPNILVICLLAHYIFKRRCSYLAHGLHIVCLFVCLFVFVALRPMSTAMVIAGRSVHLTTLFPGQA